MKNGIAALTTLTLAFICASSLHAQQSLYGNRIVSKYFTGAELQHIEQTDTLKFVYLNQLYFNSYKLEPLVCSQCRPFIPDLFDINAYDQSRAKSHRVTIADSLNGYHVTLFSKDEMEMMLKPVHEMVSAKSQIQTAVSVLPPGFPAFVQTGQIKTDLDTYLQATAVWATQHPAEYEDILKSVNTIHFIRAADFLKLSTGEQQSILSAMTRCVILKDTESK